MTQCKDTVNVRRGTTQWCFEPSEWQSEFPNHDLDDEGNLLDPDTGDKMGNVIDEDGRLHDTDGNTLAYLEECTGAGETEEVPITEDGRIDPSVSTGYEKGTPGDPQVKAYAKPAGAGEVTVEAPSDSDMPVNDAATFTVQASPNDSYTFDHWEEKLAGTWNKHVFGVDEQSPMIQPDVYPGNTRILRAVFVAGTGPDEIWDEVERESETVELEGGFTVERTLSSTFMLRGSDTENAPKGQRMQLTFDHSLAQGIS